MSAERVLAVCRLHGLDLLRRRLVLAMLAAMPVVIYLAIGDDLDGVVVGGTLMTFSIAGPAVFVVLAGRGIDQRLALAGYRPGDLVLGRVLLLDVVGLAVAAVFGGLVLVQSSPPRPGLTILGLALMALIAVLFGLALGALLPGDLEAMLAMMAVVGVQLTAGESVVGALLPYHGPSELLWESIGSDGAVAPAVVQTAVWVVVLLAVTTVATAHRTRIHRVRAAVLGAERRSTA